MSNVNKPQVYLFLDPVYKEFVFNVWSKCMKEGWASQDAREYANMLWNENKIEE